MVVIFYCEVPINLSLINIVGRRTCASRVHCTSGFIPIYNFVMMQNIGLLWIMDFVDGTGSMTCVLV